MGYSIGFLRSFLSLITLIAVVGLLLGGANEVFGLGLFSGGYPALVGARGSGATGAGFGTYAWQLGIVIAVSVGSNILLERLDR